MCRSVTFRAVALLLASCRVVLVPREVTDLQSSLIERVFRG
jgi:hypothetical protein